MRVHASSSDLFDRQAEIDTFKGVSQAGLGPHLLLLFRNGRVEEFLGEHVSNGVVDLMLCLRRSQRDPRQQHSSSSSNSSGNTAAECTLCSLCWLLACPGCLKHAVQMQCCALGKCSMHCDCDALGTLAVDNAVACASRRCHAVLRR